MHALLQPGDAAFEHIKGIQVLDMFECTSITDGAFEHLRGIHTLDISYCTDLTDAAFGRTPAAARCRAQCPLTFPASLLRWQPPMPPSSLPSLWAPVQVRG